MKETYEDVGAKVVRIVTPRGDQDEKRFATFHGLISADGGYYLSVCMINSVRAYVTNIHHVHTPSIGKTVLTCVIFKGQGQRISQAERAQYDEDVHVLFQPKAWMDREALDKWTTEYVLCCRLSSIRS